MTISNGSADAEASTEADLVAEHEADTQIDSVQAVGDQGAVPYDARIHLDAIPGVTRNVAALYEAARAQRDASALIRANGDIAHNSIYPQADADPSAIPNIDPLDMRAVRGDNPLCSHPKNGAVYNGRLRGAARDARACIRARGAADGEAVQIDRGRLCR